MSSDEDFGTSLGPLETEAGRRELLQSIVELARSVFGAKACSIMRFDGETDELVFEAVAGEGAGTLVGRRIPSRTGIAGWSLASEEPISIADVLQDPRFARDVAEETGYIPRKLAVYPLLYEERSLGVLNVLDQGASAQLGLADMAVLGRFATHAAKTLAVVEAARRGQALRAEGEEEGGAALARIARALDSVDAPRRDAASTLLDALETLLRPPS
jgi:GAF domain-containing protein